MISPRRLAEIRTLAEGRHVTVIGDLMLDEFLVGTVERISPEAPVPVLAYDSHRHMLGGAGNAARTLAALGARADVVALLGDDAAGGSVIAEAAARGVGVGGVVIAAGRSTTQKTRVIAGTQQVVRIDREASGNAGAAARDALRQAALAAIASSDAIVVSDYDKGAVTAALAHDIIQACREHRVPCVVDTKALHAAFRGATVLTPNMGELARMTRRQRLAGRDIGSAAASVMRRFAPEALLVTRSEEGMSLFMADGSRTDIPALATEVHDVTGAGDTVAAVVALGLAVGLGMAEAADLANLAASVVVRKVGTDAPSWDEMVPPGRRSSGMGRVLDLSALLAAIADRSAGGVGRVVTTNGCFDILHVGHLALLRRAKELGDTLVVLVNDDESVRRLKGHSRPLVPGAERTELVAALEPVDFVVLFGEDTPVEALGAIRPAVHVKGGDYGPGDLPEAAVVEEGGGEVVIVPLVRGRSTSEIVRRACG